MYQLQDMDQSIFFHVLFMAVPNFSGFYYIHVPYNNIKQGKLHTQHELFRDAR